MTVDKIGRIEYKIPSREKGRTKAREIKWKRETKIWYDTEFRCFRRDCSIDVHRVYTYFSFFPDDKPRLKASLNAEAVVFVEVVESAG